MEDKIRAVMGRERNPYFNLNVENGTYTSSNEESYYTKILPDETFSYDVSNNKVLANIDEFGTVKLVTFYRNSYLADDIPGVWVQKDFGQAGPFFFGLNIDGVSYDLRKGLDRTESDLLGNLFPRVHQMGESFDVWLLSFAPVSRDGKKRLRGMIYGLYLENHSENEIKAEILLPEFSPDQKDYFTIVHASGQAVECEPENGVVCSVLKNGEGIWVPVVIYAPGSYEAVTEVQEKGSTFWLLETEKYFRGMLGTLEMPEDPMTAFLLERAVYQGISAVGMSGEGKICGSNWGTFPTTRQIWMKDMYYSCLPLSMLYPEFFRDACLWFLDYGIRPKGSKYEGGVYHSVSNSLTSVLMGCMYYEMTGDAEFFREHPEVPKQFFAILEEVKKLKTEECWLIPSLWISDALSLGKYHTGTNICVWKAFDGTARLAEEVMGNSALAEEYREIAEQVKKDVERYMTTEGAFGKQYLEGIGGLTEETRRTYPVSNYMQKYVDQALVFLSDVTKGDQIQLLMHDGEESDTTLMPFYGYKSYDDPVLRNYLKFTMSTENPTYGEECRGIKWGTESGATFPGYSTGFSGIEDEETMNGEHGYLRELKRLADLDGSWWWWPYRCGTKTGDVNRLNCCGKCGWASGVFAVTMITQILGIRYDGPSKTLKFRPFSPSGSFYWRKAPVGGALLDIEYDCEENKKTVALKNRGAEKIHAEIEVMTEGIPVMWDQFTETGSFMGKRTVKTAAELEPGKEVTIVFQ